MPEQPESEPHVSMGKCDLCDKEVPLKVLETISRCCCWDSRVCENCLTTTTLAQYLKKYP